VEANQHPTQTGIMSATVIAHNSSIAVAITTLLPKLSSNIEFTMPITNIESSGPSVNAHKTDDIDKLNVSANRNKFLSKAIQQARMAKKMSQKDLASKINVKIQVMGDYESGKAVPSGQIISKIEKVLEVKLPRAGVMPMAQGVSTKCGAAKVGPLNL